jgi:hypothetical protein
MNDSMRRLAAAIELTSAGDGLRIAARVGRSTRAHRRRLHTAEQAWDAVSGRTSRRGR